MIWLACAWAASLAAGASAHTRSQSHSTWTVRGNEVRVLFTVAAREVTRLAALAPETPSLEGLLREHLDGRIGAGGGPGAGDTVECRQREAPRSLAARPGFVRAALHFDCDGPPRALWSRAFHEVAPSHLHFARVRVDGGGFAEYVLTSDRPARTLDAGAGQADPSGRAGGGGAGPGESLARYLALGVEHIAVGWDHLAFLAALLLLRARARDLAIAITGFTLGHSLTLSLAALGRVAPDATLVEAAIGYTIALVAAESVAATTGRWRSIAPGFAVALGALTVATVWLDVGPPVAFLLGLALFGGCALGLGRDPGSVQRLRPLWTALFGLVHGFGFAGVLLEIGLPQERLWPALLGFNLGVEVGQIVVVVALWTLGRLLLARARPWRRRQGLHALSAALCGLGVYWFVSRGWAL